MPHTCKFWFLQNLTVCVVLLGCAWMNSSIYGEEDPHQAAKVRGQALFAQKCASCHGAAGQGGTESYKTPLIGDASIVELTRIIDATMPEGEPEQLDKAQSEDVARYIYDAFYSPDAQIRNSPSRIELSRLTVRQYQQAVTDLLGSFRGGYENTNEFGLKATYFDGRRFRKEDKKLERIDPVVQFDFGEGKPLPDVEMASDEFSIHWTGSLVAPETGEYEIIIKTANGVEFWLNDESKILIDGRVRSGNDVEWRERINLLGGRRYRLRLQMFKSKNAKEKTAAIALWWRPPHKTEELIPSRYLLPAWTPEVFIVNTPFPPDDRSAGYERGNSISKEWEQSTTDAAIETAAYVAKKLKDLAGYGRDANPEEKKRKVREFSIRFVERAHRRPLSDDEKARMVDRWLDATEDLETAVQRIVLLTLKSPRFLYREIVGSPNDPWNVASRLSFTLCDTIPDQQLRDAAAKNELQKPDQLQRQAERLVRTDAGKAKLKTFLLNWVRVEHLHDIAKDSQQYPEFTPAIVSDLRTSLELFVDEVLQSNEASLKQLLLEDHIWMNGRLAKFYGADLPENADFQKVRIDNGQRAGVLTHPFLMAGFAYTSTTSPIHRGVFVTRSVLGRSLKMPPIAVSPEPADLHPNLSTRERVDLQTKAEMCRTCHNLINPLGFPLESFDAVGRFRAEEKGKPVDATGQYLTRAGVEEKFAGSRALAEFLATSPETRAAFTQQLFQNLVKQAWPAYSKDLLTQLDQKFAASNLNIRELAVAIAVATARVPETAETAAK
ncbi:PA14 domain protein [Planctopirus ephydatiae]|uniref:PA14 domain protein n=1 Tax=Planctopirus ephydatiae TaxID=2528019 RepID=A0A518GRW0_9PLAN|nr:DUF1592 domain-containing protein [Planctopirus ephydatiae]QDV31322.1 PA14 domain protein [Planctopirus ephydatiae]